MPETKKVAKERVKEYDDSRMLARALVERKLLSLEEAKSVLSEIQSGGEKRSFEAYCIENDILQEEEILETKASLWNVPFIDLNSYEVDPDVLELIPAQLVKEYKSYFDHAQPHQRIEQLLLCSTIIGRT